MSLNWKFKCWLYPQSVSRLSTNQKEYYEQTGKVPISLRIECNGERTARGQGKRIQVSTKQVCSPKLLHTLFPEYKPKKTSIDFNSTKAARNENKDLYSALQNFIAPYIKCVDELNSDPKKYQFVKTRKQFLEFKKDRLQEITVVNQGDSNHKLMDIVEVYLKIKSHLAEKTKKNYREVIERFNSYAGKVNIVQYVNENGETKTRKEYNLTIWDVDYNFLKKWDKWAMNNLSMKSIETYSNQLKIILEFAESIIPEYSNIPITNKNSDLSKKDRLKIYMSLLSDGAKNISIPEQNRYILRKAPKSSFKPNRYLDIEQIELLKSYADSGSAKTIQEQTALDIWFLMYYLAGCYPTDLVKMFRKSNYHRNKKYIDYQRHKTINTRSTPEIVPIHLNDHAINLINRYKSLDKKSDLLFYFWENSNVRTQDAEGVRLGDRTTRNLKQAARDLGFANLTSKMARHSNFNRLQKEKVDIEQIRIIAGHSDTATTRIYLDSLKMVDLTDAYAKL